MTTGASITTNHWPKKPSMRGIPHSFGALLAIPATIACVRHASAGIGTTSSLVYGLSLIFLLSTSALYHTPTWPIRTRMWLRRIDHLAIFVLIAGTYTPMCLMVLPPAQGQVMLIAIWSLAGLGALLSLFWPLAPRWLYVILTVFMGWIILPKIFVIAAVLDSEGLTLLVVGGLLYSVGAIAYAKHAPNPIPEVFGHHEVFHCFVLAAAACHYLAIWRIV